MKKCRLAQATVESPTVSPFSAVFWVVVCWLLPSVACPQTIIPLDGKNKLGSVSSTEKPDRYTQADTLCYQRWVGKAYIALQNDSFPQAKSFFEKALQAAPRMQSNVEILFELGQLEERENRFDKAMEYYTRSLHKNPRYVKSLMRRGGMYLLLKDFKRAVDDFSSVLYVEAHHMDALFFRGCAYARCGWVDQAEADFSAILQLAPLDPRTHFSLALLDLQRHRPYDAWVRMNGLVSRCPNDSRYYATSADAAEAMDSIVLAYRDWNSAILLSLHDISLLERYVDFLLRQGDKEKALEVVGQAERTGAGTAWIDLMRNRIRQSRKR